jgi:hypothetical protein
MREGKGLAESPGPGEVERDFCFSPMRINETVFPWAKGMMAMGV